MPMASPRKGGEHAIGRRFAIHAITVPRSSFPGRGDRATPLGEISITGHPLSPSIASLHPVGE